MIEQFGWLLPVACILLLVWTPRSQRVNGRHLSRPLARRIGRFRAGLVQIAPMGASMPLIWVDLYWEAVILQGALVVWLLDDLLYGGPDDKKKRKHEWAKIRLRMPKPIKLRLAERWAPSPT